MQPKTSCSTFAGPRPNHSLERTCYGRHCKPEHDFENRGEVRAGVLNFSVPGGFEPHMPDIAEWFAKHPPGRAGG